MFYTNKSQIYRSIATATISVTLAVVLSACGKGPLKEMSSDYPDGQVREEWSEDSSGIKQGTAITYYPNGKKQTEAEFKNGYLQGNFLMWDREGNKIADGIYKKGDPWEGTFVSVTSANRRVTFTTYKNGKLVN